MSNKRIILEISEELHKKIKDYATLDQRTISTTLRILIEEMMDTVIKNKVEREIANDLNKFKGKVTAEGLMNKGGLM